MRCLVIVALLCVAAVAARAPPSSAGSASLSGSLQPAKSSASTSGSLSGSEASAASTSASNAVPNIPLPVPSSSSSSSSSDEHSESPLPANVDTSQALAAHKALLQAAAQAKQGKGLGANNRKVTVIGNVNIMNHNEEAADKPDYNKLAADQLASAQEARVKLAEASQKARESEEERKSKVPPAVPAPPPSPSPPPAPKEESEPAPSPADTEEDLKARINDGKPFATKKEKVNNVIAEASKVPFAGQFKGAYSWTAWIKFTGPASTEPLLGLVHGGLDTQQNPAFFMQGTRFNKEGTLKIVSGTHACDTEWKPVFPRDKWFFVAVTHDADYFKVFHSLGDGVLHKPDESGCPTKPKAAPVEIKNAAVLAAGAKFSAKPAPMEWADVRRYVRSLSDEEIEKIMKQARHP